MAFGCEQYTSFKIVLNSFIARIIKRDQVLRKVSKNVMLSHHLRRKRMMTMMIVMLISQNMNWMMMTMYVALKLTKK